MAEQVLTPDLCVIGSGAGGLRLASAVAAFGVPVVLIPRGPLGEAAAMRGEAPAHALAAAARRLIALREAGRFGLGAGGPSVDFDAVLAGAKEIAASLALNWTTARLAALGVRIVEGDPRFLDARTVAAGVRVRPRRFALALGSTPHLPDIPGLAAAPYLTRDTLFDLRELPRHLIVIGAGGTGLMLAQTFRRLGSDVTVLDAGEPLQGEDRDAARIVLDRLAGEGVAIRAEARIERIEGEGGAIRVHLAGEREPFRGSHLLVASGRKRDFSGLELAAAGIEADPGGIRVRPDLRTANRRVYALGEAASGVPANERLHADLLARQILFRARVRVPAHVPRVVLTDPEIASVGPTEEEARVRNPSLRILRWPYGENERAEIERAGTGLIKIVTTARGRLLGVSIVGSGASELIALYMLALQKRMRVHDLVAMPWPHPTVAEIGESAAAGFFVRGLTNPWVRRMIRWLRIFG